MDLDFENGQVILIDKPLKWTSFDVVRKVRNTIHIKKVGHAGTLDPLATGLLILCTGKKTKEIESLQLQEKEYTGDLILGATTASYDLETAIIPSGINFSHLTLEKIQQATHNYTGNIEQIPPIYSAIKVDGVRLYKKARKGEAVEVKPRRVTVSKFIIESYQAPVVKFRIVCSKGTYIRSLVHDLGNSLGSGAYLASLRRERIGNYSINNAFQLEDFICKIKNAKINQSNFDI